RRGLSVERGRAVRVEGLDGLQAPRLPLGALGLRPGDQRPVGGEYQAGERVAQFDAVAARFVDVEEERLLDGVLVRAGLDVHSTGAPEGSPMTVRTAPTAFHGVDADVDVDVDHMVRLP
ncbi:hypothetical protein STRTUCAR8_09605, partial [Streptomyces turgidiscabies Car8]